MTGSPFPDETVIGEWSVPGVPQQPDELVNSSVAKKKKMSIGFYESIRAFAKSLALQTLPLTPA
ncbi:MAG TPA: hypothetical protein VMT91_00075, partial [Anaerolineales bacterium]|nr:hypothetical protein [Anaerolineales bacterium]